MADMVCILTQPEELHDMGISPIGDDAPENVVFCCFFRDAEPRSDLLARLHQEAGQRPVEADETAAEVARLSRLYSRCWQSDRTEDALAAVIRWRTLVLRRGYHTYTLKEGYPPYRFGCIVAFEALGAAELRETLDRARAIADGERGRIMDVFGWGVME